LLTEGKIELIKHDLDRGTLPDSCKESDFDVSLIKIPGIYGLTELYMSYLSDLSLKHKGTLITTEKILLRSNSTHADKKLENLHERYLKYRKIPEIGEVDIRNGLINECIINQFGGFGYMVKNVFIYEKLGS